MVNIHILNPYNTIGGGSISQISLNKVISSTSLFENVYTYNLKNRLKKIKVILNVISIANSNNDYIIIQGLFDIEYILIDLFLTNKKNLIIIPRGAFVPQNSIFKIVNNTKIKRFFWNLIIKKRVNTCASWVPTSILEQKRLIDVGASKNNSIIIPDYFNGNERFLEISDDNIDRELKKENYFLYVGRISIEKNISFLIDVFDSLNKKNDQFKLIILSPLNENKYYESIINKIANLKLQNKIIIKSNTTQSEIVSFYKNTKLILLPSHIESLGLIVLEAIFFNKFIFISDNVPFDLNGTNLGAKLNLDVNLWVNSIFNYLTKDENLLNKSKKELLLSNYSFDKIRNLWHTFFTNIYRTK